MKNTFREQFDLEKKQIKDIWKNALVVFDTNVLLNLYRYDKETCDDLLKYMKTFKDRLWMPFQVGWEYHNNRLNVSYKSLNAYNELKKIIENNRKNIDDFFQNKYPHHPQLSSSSFFNYYDKLEKKLKKYLEGLEKRDQENLKKDTILEQVAELYNGKVGKDYSEAEFKEICKEGENRYKLKIPPGYKDDTKEKQEKGYRHLYGDFIIWRQIIDKALADKKDFIFVSDDLKEDWILVLHGKKIGPRKELLKEFYDKTDGKSILIYNQNQFLTYAHRNENADIKKNTITEVKRVSKEQNNLLKYNINTQYQPIHMFFDNKGLLSSLDGCINLGDNLQLQAKNIKSVLESYNQTTKYTDTSDYLNPLSSNIFSSQILKIGSDLDKNAYSYLGKIGTKDKD